MFLLFFLLYRYEAFGCFYNVNSYFRFTFSMQFYLTIRLSSIHVQVWLLLYMIIKECFYYFFLLYRYEAFGPMHKRYNSRSELYRLCIGQNASYLYYSKNYRNIPYDLIKMQAFKN